MENIMTDPYVQQTDLRTPDPVTEDQSTADVVKSQGRQVADDAAEGGKHVAQVAAGEASSVAREATDQARSLMDQASSQLSAQAADQKQTLVSWLRTLADELQAMAGATGSSANAVAEQPSQSGVATGLAERGAEYAHRTASWLDDREPSAVLSEVGSFARRRPGTFLVIAAAAGVLVGRLTRGLVAGTDDDDGTRLVGTDMRAPTTQSYGGVADEPTWSSDLPDVDLGSTEPPLTTSSVENPPQASRTSSYPEAGR
jgi:hypothetical protein